MARMLGRFRRGHCHPGCPLCSRPVKNFTRWRKRVEARETASEVRDALTDAELVSELPDPRILDDYEDVLPGARDRLLRMRRLTGTWEGAGVAVWSAQRQVDRELRHEVPGWPGVIR